MKENSISLRKYNLMFKDIDKTLKKYELLSHTFCYPEQSFVTVSVLDL